MNRATQLSNVLIGTLFVLAATVGRVTADVCYYITPSGSCEDSFGEWQQGIHCSGCDAQHRCETGIALYLYYGNLWDQQGQTAVAKEPGEDGITPIFNEWDCIIQAECESDCAHLPQHDIWLCFENYQLATWTIEYDLEHAPCVGQP